MSLFPRLISPHSDYFLVRSDKDRFQGEMTFNQGQEHWVGFEQAEIKWRGVCGKGAVVEAMIRGNDRSHWYVWQKRTAFDGESEMSELG